MEETEESVQVMPENEKDAPGSEENPEQDSAKNTEAETEVSEVTEDMPAEAAEDIMPAEGSLPDYAKTLEDRIARLELQFAEKERELREMAQENLLRSHYSSLERQAEEMKRRLPEFNLSRELEDPEFLRLTSPDIGLSVENAYYALHHSALMEEAEKRGAMAVSESISSRAVLPGENGSVRRGAVSSQPRLYSRMSPEERLEQKRLILAGMRFQ